MFCCLVAANSNKGQQVLLKDKRDSKGTTKPKPFEEPKSSKLRGKKKQDVYIKVYNMKEKI